MSQSPGDGGASPARITRIQEKEELAHLNDRFLSYIEQVRQVKDANMRLEFELQTTKEKVGNETEAVKALYESELADARNLIDETAKEKARQQILASKNSCRIEELEAELKHLKDELERLEARIASSERNSSSLDAQRKAALADKTKLHKQVKELEEELEELRGQLDGVKQTLEVETLGKVDLQNNIQSLKEELAFRRKVYEEELAGLREKMSLSASGVFETEVQHHLEGRLEVAIDELRERSETEISEFKLQLETVYKNKIEALENQSVRDANTIHHLNSEIKKISRGMGDNHSEIAKLQKSIEKLEALLREKEEELIRCRQHHSEELSRLVEQLRDLRASYELKIGEYEELMDLKVHLDQEIATYRSLLQEEETRLNLTPTPREKRTRSRTQVSTEQVTKKPRLDPEPTETQQSAISASAAGCVQICDVDSSGRYVKIKNLSTQIETLGGFKIIHQVDDEKEIVFRFHNKSKLQGGTSVTVWGNGVDGATHAPPADIVWRAHETWGFGKKVATRLLSKTGEVVATFTQRSEITPSKSFQRQTFESVDAGARSFPHIPERHEEGSTTVTTTTTRYTAEQRPQLQQVGDEHMFHQQGDPNAADRSDKCILS